VPTGRLVEVGRELRERGEFAILREGERMPPPSFLMMSVCAAPPTRDTRYRRSSRDGYRVEEIGFDEICPSVIEMTFAARTRDVARLVSMMGNR